MTAVFVRGTMPRNEKVKGEIVMEQKTMTADRIRDLMQDVMAYRQAIRDTQDALDAAERELDEALEAAWDGRAASPVRVLRGSSDP